MHAPYRDLSNLLCSYGLCTAAYEYSLACLFHVKHNEL